MKTLYGKNDNGFKTGFHVTHDDADAVGCSLILETISENVNWKHWFCSVSKNSERNIDITFSTLLDAWNADLSIVPDILVVTDISIQRETEEKFKEFLDKNFNKKGRSTFYNEEREFNVVWIDHHKTNHMTSEFIYIDKSEKISATGILFAELALSSLNINMNVCPDLIDSFKQEGNIFINTILQFLLNEDKITKLNVINLARISYDISRYDTYLWKKSPSKAGHEFDVNALTRYFECGNTVMLLLSFLKKLELNETFLLDYDNPIQYPKSLMAVINEYEKKELEMKEYALENYKIIDNFDDSNHKVAVLLLDNEHNTHHNEQAEAIYTKEKDIHYVLIMNNDDNMAVSLRTNRTDINLGELCKTMWNGGGHPQAAGATLTKEQKNSMIQKYESV